MEADRVPLVVVTGVIQDDRIEIRSVMRLEIGPTPGGERLEGTMIGLLDEAGEVLERAPLRVTCAPDGWANRAMAPTGGQRHQTRSQTSTA